LQRPGVMAGIGKRIAAAMAVAALQDLRHQSPGNAPLSGANQAEKRDVEKGWAAAREALGSKIGPISRPLLRPLPRCPVSTLSAPAALNSPNEADRKTRARSTEPRASGGQMGRTVAAFAVAASLLPLASSEASAWVCFATGLGSSGYARAYDIIDAKLFALRQCERRSPVPNLYACVVPPRWPGAEPPFTQKRTRRPRQGQGGARALVG
jgi:hypothetical protein